MKNSNMNLKPCSHVKKPKTCYHKESLEENKNETIDLYPLIIFNDNNDKQNNINMRWDSICNTSS